MAGFFTLGSGGGGIGCREPTTTSSQHQQPPPPPHNLLLSAVGGNEAINPWGNSSVVLYRNEETYQKGFEIWQQYVQVHHHHHAAAAAAAAATSALPSSGSGPVSGIAAPSRGTRSGGVGGINCQDCGNQAKKDCAHLRCRTCCMSRGFDCPTHVKSTWVPAAQRRERQQQRVTIQQQQNSNQQSDQLMMNTRGGGGEKRLRNQNSGVVVPSASTTRNILATNTISAGLELGHHFPAEVSSPAVFRCVRVNSIDDGEEHLAYQTAVSIAGHVFKGILYDRGPEGRYGGGGDEDSPRGSSGLQQHNLLCGIGIGSTENVGEGAEAANSQQGGGGGTAAAGRQHLLDPNSSGAASAMYPTPINAFLAGTQFFPSR